MFNFVHLFLRFEAYMMTGDLMLNLSRTQQSSSLVPKHQKKVDSLRYNNHHTNHQHHNHHNHHHHHHHHNSVPTSPNEMMSHNRAYKVSGSNSASTSPVGVNKRDGTQCSSSTVDSKTNGNNFGYSSGFVRTSRSEDHLQFQKDPSMSAVDIDIDDDVTSSLNTLLDTRAESNQGLSSERIVWTYNAPVSSPSASERTSCCANGSSSSESTEATSPQRSLSPASPTSVSSSVMSSNSGSRRFPVYANQGTNNVLANAAASAPSKPEYHPAAADLSQSEAFSNMSSPDYNDEETLDILSARDMMMVSDPSDSDSTILASEPPQRRRTGSGTDGAEHRIVIQVKGPDKDRNQASPRQNRRRNSPATTEIHSAAQAVQRNSAGQLEYLSYQVRGRETFTSFRCRGLCRSGL